MTISRWTWFSGASPNRLLFNFALYFSTPRPIESELNETERSAYLNHQEVEFKSQDDEKFLNEIDQTSGDNETGGPLRDDEENLLLDIRQKHNNARPDTEPMILNQVRTHQALTFVHKLSSQKHAEASKTHQKLIHWKKNSGNLLENH